MRVRVTSVARYFSPRVDFKCRVTLLQCSHSHCVQMHASTSERKMCEHVCAIKWVCVCVCEWECGCVCVHACAHAATHTCMGEREWEIYSVKIPKPLNKIRNCPLSNAFAHYGLPHIPNNFVQLLWVRVTYFELQAKNTKPSTALPISADGTCASSAP